MPNIFANIPENITEEVFESIVANEHVKIERILSKGQVTTEGEWYDQEWDEWVMILRGGAKLLIEGRQEVLLQQGDYYYIPAHQRHRVTWTDPDQPTVWLAIHIYD